MPMPMLFHLPTLRADWLTTQVLTARHLWAANVGMSPEVSPPEVPATGRPAILYTAGEVASRCPSPGTATAGLRTFPTTRAARCAR
eukprot:Skav231278  [mRNA]  locus=scaffold161:49038:51496:- [translate_table: standard]